MDYHMADGDTFTFVDFLPENQKQGGFFTDPIYENFRILVDRANDFLRSNRKWEIVTCESIKLRAIDDYVVSNSMTYPQCRRMEFIRGLRLWLKERKEEKENGQQIGYMNLIPRRLDNGCIFNSPTFETLDTVIFRFNSMLRSNPFPGRIITIESLEMKDSCSGNFHPDRSYWSEKETFNIDFTFVLRIFYETSAGRSEDIGIKDFVPRKISGIGICCPPNYEPFSTAVKEASAWLSQQQDLRFCNAQTLEIKHTIGRELNTQKMDYTVSGSGTTFVRILRVAYTKPFIKPFSINENSAPIIELACRSFAPVQLIKGCCPEHEILEVTRERISAWVKATGAHVLSAETTIYPFNPGQQKTETSSYFKGRKGYGYWIYIIRLYLDGIYEEPPPEMLPALPVPECCCIIS